VVTARELGTANLYDTPEMRALLADRLRRDLAVSI